MILEIWEAGPYHFPTITILQKYTYLFKDEQN